MYMYILIFLLSLSLLSVSLSPSLPPLLSLPPSLSSRSVIFKTRPSLQFPQDVP